MKSIINSTVSKREFPKIYIILSDYVIVCFTSEFVGTILYNEHRPDDIGKSEEWDSCYNTKVWKIFNDNVTLSN